MDVHGGGSNTSHNKVRMYWTLLSMSPELAAVAVALPPVLTRHASGPPLLSSSADLPR